MIEMLVQNGLKLLAKVGAAKGTAWLKEKTGVDLDKEALSSEDVLKLKQYELEHERELEKIALERETAENRELSERHKADMGSDSWLSKNVRPIVLASVTVFVGIGVLLPVSYIGADRFKTVADLALWVYGFYFGARSAFDKGSLADIAGKLRK